MFASSSATPPVKADPAVAWTRAQRKLHWWTAGLVLFGFALGWVMLGVPTSQLLAKFLLFQLHKTVGLIVFGLAGIRLLVRLRRGRPAWEATLPSWQRRAARLVHALLYALLVMTPILGYLTAATAPAQVPTLFLGVIPVPHLVSTNAEAFAVLRQVHRVLAVTLVALASGHALAAVHNHFQGRATLVSMWRGA
jgi:cytochrome b561